MITKLQSEFNNLYYHYFTTIGVLQRDYNKENINDAMLELSKNIKESSQKIIESFQVKKASNISHVSFDFDRYVSFLEDHLSFIDSI